MLIMMNKKAKIPSVSSRKTLGNELSITPKSLEKAEINLPVGILSKYVQGERKIPSSLLDAENLGNSIRSNKNPIDECKKRESRLVEVGLNTSNSLSLCQIYSIFDPFHFHT